MSLCPFVPSRLGLAETSFSLSRFFFALLNDLCTFGSQGMKCYE